MKKRRFADGTQSVAAGTALIVVVMVIVFGAAFYWMYTHDMLYLPAFLEDFLGLGDDGDAIPWDLDELSEIIRDGKSEGGEQLTFDVTYENLRAALLSEQPEEGIYIRARVTYYDEGEASDRRVIYIRDGERFRVEQYASDSGSDLETVKIADDKTIFFRDEATGLSRSIPRADDISPENEAGIPSVDVLLGAVENFPDTADALADAGVVDHQLTLVRTEAGNVYYVAFTWAELGIREEYYVSLDHRMVIWAHTTRDGEPLYTYRTLSWSFEPAMYAADGLYDVSA